MVSNFSHTEPQIDEEWFFSKQKDKHYCLTCLHSMQPIHRYTSSKFIFSPTMCYNHEYCFSTQTFIWRQKVIDFDCCVEVKYTKERKRKAVMIPFSGLQIKTKWYKQVQLVFYLHKRELRQTSWTMRKWVLAICLCWTQVFLGKRGAFECQSEFLASRSVQMHSRQFVLVIWWLLSGASSIKSTSSTHTPAFTQ